MRTSGGEHARWRIRRGVVSNVDAEVHTQIHHLEVCISSRLDVVFRRRWPSVYHRFVATCAHTERHQGRTSFDSMTFSYKTIAVIGATSGIGKAIAERLPSIPSAPTVIAVGRRQERLDELAKSSNGKIKTIRYARSRRTKRRRLICIPGLMLDRATRPRSLCRSY